MTAYAPTVNIEALVVTIMRAAGHSEAHAERIGAPLPFLLVSAAGGGERRSDNPGWAQTKSIQIDAWAATKEAAFDLFHASTLALITSVRSGVNVTSHGVLVRATIPEPNYSPDEDVDADGRHAPRYFSIATITAHPPD